MSSKKVSTENILKKSPSSKKKIRRKIPSVLNRSFIEKQISELKNEATTLLEEEMLRIKKIELERCSTPNLINICEHCDHSHELSCCAYIYDKKEDVMNYASFKKSVDGSYWTSESEEDFDLNIGSTTPALFPAYTRNVSEAREVKKFNNYLPPPIVYFSQYLWPLPLLPAFLPQQNFFQNNLYFVQQPQPVYYNNYIPPQPPQVQPQYIPYHQNYYNQKGYPQQFFEIHNYIPVNYVPPTTPNWM